MIGILLALQVNNWNESKKLLETEIQIYKEIHSELEETLNDLEDDKHDIQHSFNASLIVRDIIVKGEFNTDSLLKYLPEVFDLEQSHPKSSAFESLKSQGLTILSNDSLRHKITTLYQLSIPSLVNSDVVVENAKFRNKIYPLLEPYLVVDRNQVVNDRNSDSFAWSRKLERINIIDQDKFLKDELLLLTLQKSLSWRGMVIKLHEMVIKEINQVLKEIKDEIDHL